MKQCEVLFLGTSAFACPSLQALHDHPFIRVTHVVTQPDRPAGRGQIMTASPVKLLAESLGIAVLQPEDINTAKEVLNLHCDILVVVAYGQILREQLLSLPSIAPVNLHASLLPRWRGSSPIEHAILHGDTETGVTIQRMVRKLDAGPILAQKILPLKGSETAPILRTILAAEGATLLAATVVRSAKGECGEQEQDDSLVTQCKKFRKQDGDIDHAAITAEAIHRMVRAFDPWPGVRLTIGGKTVKLVATSLSPDGGGVPLRCHGNTILYLLRLQEPSLRPVQAQEWFRTSSKGIMPS